MSLYNKFFYHQLIRKYVIAFGSLFNNLYVVRNNSNQKELEREIVPLAYSQREKFMARITQDNEDQQRVSIKLPRIGFEISSYEYDPDRKLSSSRKVIKDTGNSVEYFYNPVPYNIEFNLFIAVKSQEEGLQIVEQIIPFFTPDHTIAMKLTDIDEFQDIPISLNSVSVDDTFEGLIEERRIITWTLAFTLKGYLFGPKRSTGKILTTIINTYNSDIIPSQGEIDPKTGMVIVNSFEGSPGSESDQYYYVSLGNSVANFKITKELDATLDLEIKNDQGQPYDFTSSNVTIAIRTSYSNSTFLTLPVVVVSAGVIRVSLPSSLNLEIRSYLYQINVENVDNSFEKVLEGFFSVVSIAGSENI